MWFAVFLFLLVIASALSSFAWYLLSPDSMPSWLRGIFEPKAGNIIAPLPTREFIESPMEDTFKRAAQVGDVGETDCELRPVGKAWFGDVLVDVVTEGAWIGKGRAVRVVDRRGNRVVVRPTEDS
jgi:membrane-bound serine protease (ClpP class)